jgi:hypothetical protein
MINFIKSGFNTNCGYFVKEMAYPFLGISCIGYVLYKEYKMFWLTGYDRVEVFVDKKSLDEYLEVNKIKLI